MPDIVVIKEPNTTVVVTQTTQTVEVEAPGPQGSTGPQGVPGASGGARYSHVQTTPSTAWSITHGLGYRPHVTVLNAAGDEISDGVKVNHIDINNVSVLSGLPISGRAELS